MLVGARSRDGGDSLPPDSLIERFAGDVTEACEPEPSLSLAEAAAGLYLVGRAQYAP